MEAPLIIHQHDGLTLFIVLKLIIYLAQFLEEFKLTFIMLIKQQLVIISTCSSSVFWLDHRCPKGRPVSEWLAVLACI
jgi:hypothetical protein